MAEKESSELFSEKEVLSKGRSRVRPLESTSFLKHPERTMNTQATSRTFIIQVELVPGFWVNYWDNGFPMYLTSSERAGEVLARYMANEPEQTFRVTSLEG